ncbi:MAG: 2-hydroxyacid dehydrogenase [Opitutaceae bacterium]|nr:2-hydroxyacid dehydrogenase [Cytophagales bacterium]
MKVTIYSIKAFERKYLEVANAGKHELVFFEQPLSKQTISLADGSEAICLFTNDDACPENLYELGKLGVKFIATRATGYDNISVSHAQALGMQVAHVKSYSPYAIAEHAVALMLALNRKLLLADKQVKENNFLLDNLIGFDFNGKKIGILGCGKIGSVVAKIMHGFGCEILVHDQVENQDLIAQYNVQYCTLEQLIKTVDIISIHIPLNSVTKYLFNKELIQKLKPGVMLINTGRGGVLDTKAAIEGVENGQIGYLGLDVYENEKGMFFFDHSKDQTKDPIFAKLLSLENVIVTGHQAFLTETALQNIADSTIYNLDCFQDNVLSSNIL